MYSKYHNAIAQEMVELSKIPNSLFLGQQVLSEDFYSTLKDVPKEKRLEMPVAEEMQLGMSIGMALEGCLPISIFQRMDFLPRAADQLINHLNLIHKMSRGLFKPKVIIRTTIGTTNPFDVGFQHSQDLTEVFKQILTFPVVKVTTVTGVHTAYDMARNINSPILIIEEQSLYYE